MTAKKKILSVVLVIALVAITVVGSSLAYFTDKTDTKTNAFTMGDVDIELYEPDWQGNTPTLMPGVTFDKDPFIGVKADSQDAWVFMEVTVNKFNSWLQLNAGLYEAEQDAPQYTYLEKDGTISETFAARLNDKDFTMGLIERWFTGGNENNLWQLMNWNEIVETVAASWNDSSIKEVKLIFGYNKTLAANEYTDNLFSFVTMPKEVTSDMIDLSGFNTEKADWKINVTGYAIQAAEIDDANKSGTALDEAYTALFDAE